MSDFYQTVLEPVWVLCSTVRFNMIVDKYRNRFVGSDGLVFGSVLVPCVLHDDVLFYQTTPREKAAGFRKSVEVRRVEGHTIHVCGKVKATLNAPLLIRVSQKYENRPVLHLHEFLPNVPTVPWAQPGSVADNERDIPGPAFNIEGHGFVAVLDENLEILSTDPTPYEREMLRTNRLILEGLGVPEGLL